MVEVVNIVASGNFGRELDLHALSADLDVPSSEYDPEQFSGLQVRFEHVKGVILLYSTGSYSVMGAQTEVDVNDLYDSTVTALDELGVDATDSSQRPEIRNLICKGDIERELYLSTLTIALGAERVEYEPEQSPFVYYWPDEPSCLITISTNGEIIITGVETVDAAEEAFEHLRTRVNQLPSGN